MNLLGRVTSPAGQSTPTPTVSATPPAQPQLAIGTDGRIAGLDGVLDQIGEALSRQVVPIVRDTALPILQRDTELQKTIGAAAGAAAARELKPFLYIGLGLGALAVYLYYKRGR